MPDSDKMLDATLTGGGAATLAAPGLSLGAATLATVAAETYEMSGEIGRGGLGRVVRARDVRLGRTVAIKELLSAEPDAQARFLREALVTARLEHPAIIPIHEAGRWPSGAPFYAMKLVSGRTLASVLDDAHTLVERMAYLPNVIAVGDAVAYAHSQRVIHRDLKPQNVLVGAFGETVLIDWGLAKDLAAATIEPGPAARPDPPDSQLTVEGSVMGTPAYMPPEQAAGDPVDERADVYALGAMLHHLLAGAPPYRGRDSLEVLRSVRLGPPPPLAADLAVPQDLRAIVERAMARDPARRYPTARELTEDLKRFQAGQLVASHRYSLGQLVRRWLRRHRAAFAVAAVAGVLLAALAGVGLHRIVAEQHRAEAERGIAQQRRADIEELMGFMLFDLRDKLEPIGRLDLLGAVAGKASEYYARFTETENDAAARRRSVALSNVGDVLRAQGDDVGALREFRASLAIAEELAARHPDDEDLQHDLAACHQRVGAVLAAQGDAPGGLAELRTAEAIAERIAARDPAETQYQEDLVLNRRHIADVLLAQGDAAGALAEQRAALAVAEKRVSQDPADAGWQHDLAVSHRGVADALTAVGDNAGALLELRAGVAIIERLTATDADNAIWQRDLTISHQRMAAALVAQGDDQGALAETRVALDVAERLAARDPANADWQNDLSVLHGQLGENLEALGAAPAAIAEYRAALAVREPLARKNPTDARLQRGLSIEHLNIGNLLESQGDAAGALAEYRTAQALTEKLVARDPSNATWQADLAAIHNSLGDVLTTPGDVAKGLLEYRQALAILELLAAKDPGRAEWQRDVCYCHESIGGALLAQKDAAGALAEFRSCLAIREQLLTRNPENTAWQRDEGVSHGNVGKALLAEHDLAGAQTERAAELARLSNLAAHDPTNPELQLNLCASHEGLADTLVQTGDVPGATREYRAALLIAEQLQAADPGNAERRADVARLQARVRSPRPRP